MSEERESAVADDSIFAPRSVQNITDRIERIANERCDCRTGRHLDALHDLAVDDVPWLIARLREAEAEIADRDAEAMNLRAERDELTRDPGRCEERSGDGLSVGFCNRCPMPSGHEGPHFFVVWGAR